MREMRGAVYVSLASLSVLSGCGWAAIVGATAAAGGGGGGGGGGGTTVVQAETVPQATAPAVTADFGAGRAVNLEAVEIKFNLIESTSEPAAVAVEFSTDGVNFRAITTASPLIGLATSPEGREQTVVWNATADKLSGLNKVSLRVTPRDSTGAGQVQKSNDIEIGNDPPVVSEISLGNSQPATGNLVVRYKLADSSGDVCAITAQYRINGGMWRDITGQDSGPDEPRKIIVGGNPAGLATDKQRALPFDFTWNTKETRPADLLDPTTATVQTDIATAVSNLLEIRITPLDAFDVGEAGFGGPFLINNNSLARANLKFDGSNDFSGLISIPFSLEDEESDAVRVVVQYKTLNQADYPDLNDASVNYFLDPSDPRCCGSSIEDPSVFEATLSSPALCRQLQIVTEAEFKLRAFAGSDLNKIISPGIADRIPYPPFSRTKIRTLSGETIAVSRILDDRIILADSGNVPPTISPGSELFLSLGLQQSSLQSFPQEITNGVTYRLLWDSGKDITSSTLLALKLTPFEILAGSQYRKGIPAESVNQATSVLGLLENTAISPLKTGPVPREVVIADINNDNRSDLIVANQDVSLPTSRDISVFLQSSNGQYAEAPYSPIAIEPSQMLVRTIACADVTNDGVKDLIIGLSDTTDNSGRAYIAIYRQAVSGTLERQTSLLVDDLSEIVSINTLSLSPDNRTDLAVLYNKTVVNSGSGATNSTTTGVIRFFLQDQLGTLGDQAVINPISLFGTAFQAVSGDFNRDGLEDIAAAFGAGKIKIFYQHALGQFSDQFSVELMLPTQSSRAEFTLAVADFDNDSDLDLFAAGSLGVFIFRQSELGSFDSQEYVMTEVDSRGPLRLAVGDVTNDGMVDVILSDTGFRQLNLILQSSDGSISPALTSPLIPASAPAHVAIGDVNEDGLNDVVCTAASTDSLEIFTQSNTGRFSSEIQTIAINDVGLLGQVKHGDVNRDGLNDVVVASFGAGLPRGFSTLLQGPQGLAPSAIINSSLNSQFAGEFIVDFSVADLNGDFAGDIVVVSKEVMGQSPAVWIKAFDQFGLQPGLPGRRFLYQLPETPSDIAIGDVNNDGLSDVLVSIKQTGVSSNVLVFLATGSNDFLRDPYSLPIEGNLVSQIVVGDLDGDGKNDLAAATIGPDFINIFTQDSSGMLLADNSSSFAPAISPDHLVIGDSNSDGYGDLVMAQSSIAPAAQGNLVVYRRDSGAGPFLLREALDFSRSYSGLAIADFNGDGRQDLFALTRPADLNSNAETIVLTQERGNLLNENSVRKIIESDVSLVPSGFTVADFNGDGLIDVSVGFFQSRALRIFLQK